MRRRLRALGARKIKTEQELNEMLDDRGALRRSGRGLRLRRAGGTSAELTYKGPVSGGTFKKRVEIELAVDYAAMKAILSALGYRTALRYEKVRETYRLAGALVTVDKLLGVGYFLEIEGPHKTIRTLERRLGLGPADRESRTYPALVAANKKPSDR